MMNPMNFIQMIKGGNPQQIAMSLIQNNNINDPMINELIGYAERGDMGSINKIAENITSNCDIYYYDADPSQLTPVEGVTFKKYVMPTTIQLPPHIPVRDGICGISCLAYETANWDDKPVCRFLWLFRQTLPPQSYKPHLPLQDGFLRYKPGRPTLFRHLLDLR